LVLTTVRGIIVAHIESRKPEVFQRRLRKDGSLFRASEAWCRKFVKKELNWVMRKPTRAAKKVPQDAEDQIYRSFLRISLSFRDARIQHAALMINFDQTQIVYHLGSGFSYDVRGTKQVSVVNHEEKRAFTLTVGISLAGDLLPFHATFKGKSNQSLPKTTASKYDAAEDLGFVFSYSNTDTYWATLDIVKLYISDIVVPYWDKKKAELGCKPSQECILQMDVWSVHRSKDLRDWLRDTYPWIIIEYIPGGCT
ncbi:hypothetical protein SCHPADRAFT_788445, partial [Schizopora paradoxa]